MTHDPQLQAGATLSDQPGERGATIATTFNGQAIS